MQTKMQMKIHDSETDLIVSSVLCAVYLSTCIISISNSIIFFYDQLKQENSTKS